MERTVSMSSVAVRGCCSNRSCFSVGLRFGGVGNGGAGGLGLLGS